VNAREHILGRLRSARGTARLPRVDAPAAAPVVVASPKECLARFSVEAAALGVECYVEDTAADVRHRLQTLVRGHRIVSWNFEHLPYDSGSVLDEPTFGAAPRTVQANAEVGITGCDAAVAETASLVLFSGAGRSRAVSLLPSFHIALVTPERICLSMAEVFEKYADRLDTSASCTFITGPSRTADIELTLTLGIHGPGRVAVIIGP
jgi:L-lactate dehydrogenase complex protein LldG